ncbi:MAG TPA: ATP-binding protein, partial [Thermodesulfobacteriota bacterium]|nr:ATP-binding protein [Thermodesulfobacteriota bacterium]
MINEIRLAAAPENLSILLRFVRRLLEQSRFPEQRALEIETAAEEVFVNIIRYAYSSEGPPGSVEVRGCVGSEDEIALEFEDGGAPFDPTSIPPPD